MKNKYMEAKMNTWAPSTIKPTMTRLKLIDEQYLPSNPQGLYEELARQGYGAYYVKQVMLLAKEVARFNAPTKETYTAFMRERRRLFTNAYSPKRVDTTFDAALKAIEKMQPVSRDFAIGLLVSGLRVSEAANVTADGQVVGKGNKLRQVPNADLVTSAPRLTVQTFRRELMAATGLTPHQLRKLAATKLVELGAREAELCAMLGWSSFTTASIYVQARQVDELSTKLRGLVNAK